MAISKRITATTTAGLVNSTDADGRFGASLLLRNVGSASVYVGASTVTSTTGFEVEAGGVLALDLLRDSLYVVTASGTVICHVLEAGV